MTPRLLSLSHPCNPIASNGLSLVPPSSPLTTSLIHLHPLTPHPKAALLGIPRPAASPLRHRLQSTTHNSSRQPLFDKHRRPIGHLTSPLLQQMSKQRVVQNEIQPNCILSSARRRGGQRKLVKKTAQGAEIRDWISVDGREEGGEADLEGGEGVQDRLL